MAKHKQSKTAPVETKTETVTLTKAQYDALIATSRKVTKELSEVFFDSEGNALKYRNLSETKKYFEENHLAWLLTKGKLTSKQFHQILSAVAN